MVEDYGRTSGYNQTAPGLDVSPAAASQPKRRPNPGAINSAIMGGLPLGQATFRGAQTTTGAPPLQPSAIDSVISGGIGASAPPPASHPTNGGYSGPLADAGNVTPAPPVNPFGAYTPGAGVDLDGYQAPGHVADHASGVMGGWQQDKWDDPNNQHPKYVVGRILSQYGAASPENLAKAMPEIQAAYPGAQFNGKDKISLDGKSWVDVGVAFGSGDPNAMKYAWQPDDAGGQQQAQQVSNPMIASAITGSATPQVGGDDYAARIRQQVMQALASQPGLASLAGQYNK